MHLRRVLREKNGGLAGRIAAADDDYFVLRAHLRFKRRRPVPDAAAFELLDALYLRTAIPRPARNHDRARSKPSSVAERQHELTVGCRARAVERSGLRGNKNLRPEFLCLHE